MSNSSSTDLDQLRTRLEKLESKIYGVHENCECHEDHSQSRNTLTDRSGQSDVSAVAAESILSRGRASVDSTRSDNGFLACIRNGWARTNNMSVFDHGSTAVAFSNIRGGSESFSIVGGHGAPGLIVCGTGQVVGSSDKYMSVANEASWRSIVSQGISGSQLTLFGCKVAAGTDGANFLQRVANALRKPVGGWTGDVWCNPSQIWGTGSFIVVQPGSFVEPVEAPELFVAEKEMTVFHLPTPDGVEEIPATDIRAVNFTPVGNLPHSPTAFSARGGQALSIVELVDFAHPLVTNDKPGAILVGILTITYEVKNEERMVSFRVLAYSLLQDIRFPNTYYNASSKLIEFLQKRR
ncbi:DUF4347 domain-containing protein [Hyphomicrobium sp.]|uniref:DUF4347 domain-containing protein n=1 Tax=Hyphomicrobium sp. TaxID=82 RepID=UPI003F701160